MTNLTDLPYFQTRLEPVEHPVRLILQQFMVSMLMDPNGLTQNAKGYNCELVRRYNLEAMAEQMTLSFRTFTEEPIKRVIATYPPTLFDHIKKKLGLKHKLVEVYQAETVAYPTISADRYKNNAVLYVHNETAVKSSNEMVLTK